MKTPKCTAAVACLCLTSSLPKIWSLCNWVRHFMILSLSVKCAAEWTEDISLKWIWIVTIIVCLLGIFVIFHNDCFSLITKHPSQFQWPFWVRHCPYGLPDMILGSILGCTFRKLKIFYMCFFWESVYLDWSMHNITARVNNFFQLFNTNSKISFYALYIC